MGNNIDPCDLTKNQLGENNTTGLSRWSIFLPALSSFYSTYVGKQRFDQYVDPTRIPTKFENGIEGMNWLNEKEGYFTYKWSLYSAGHANLDVNKFDPREDMIRNRDRSKTFILADSGGFQIGKGVWEGDWKNPSCPKSQKKREQVLSWMDAYMDYGMILDIPVWVCDSDEGRKASGVNSFDEAVEATYINNDYFMKNRTGACKFLNVLQGGNHSEANDWYQRMKKYCDPAQYEQPFNGWAMGGQNKCSPTLALKRLVTLREDKLLEKGQHDLMHFLGTSKLEWALFLTDIQNAVRKHHNENFTVSFDCASPFLATANGQMYSANEYVDRKKWVYRMGASVDNKKYATDNRKLADVLVNDKIFKRFEDSPISDRLLISDVCKYAAGDLNKIGKEGKTSWDSFSYALQMGHNVHRHIAAVQEANRLYENKTSCPKMLVDERHDKLYASDLINEIFASDTGVALALIEKHDSFLTGIIGTSGNTGKREANSLTHYKSMFVESKHSVEIHHIDDSGLDDTLLEQMNDNATD